MIYTVGQFYQNVCYYRYVCIFHWYFTR